MRKMTEVHSRPDVSGRKVQRPFETGARLIRPTLVVADEPQGEVGVSGGWMARQRLAQRRRRFVEPALPAQDQAQVVSGLQQIWLDFEGAPIAGRGRFELAGALGARGLGENLI
jgi:hypothetical protein